MPAAKHICRQQCFPRCLQGGAPPFFALQACALRLPGPALSGPLPSSSCSALLLPPTPNASPCLLPSPLPYLPLVHHHGCPSPITWAQLQPEDLLPATLFCEVTRASCPAAFASGSGPEDITCPLLAIGSLPAVLTGTPCAGSLACSLQDSPPGPLLPLPHIPQEAILVLR